MLFFIFFFLLIIIYALVIFSTTAAWSGLKEFQQEKTPPAYTKLSVIIAVRNESKTIENSINCLIQQEYPPASFEIVYIDDHSEDSTIEILKKRICEVPNIKLLQLPPEKTGKKDALKFGAMKTHGEVCVFTDADCIVGPQWLTSLNSFYISQNKPDLIIGLVDLLPASSLLQKCFRLEFLSLILTSAGASAMGQPVFCNGANLAVKKQEYLDLQDLNNKVASGDDVFLLHKFKALKKTIKILKSKDHLVTTKPPNSCKEFISQRLRWGTKAKYYTDKATFLLAMLVFFVNIALLAGLFISLFQNSLLVFLTGFFLKIMADLALFSSGSNFFRLRSPLLMLPVLEFVYPFYIAYVALLSIKKPSEWKGRIIK